MLLYVGRMPSVVAIHLTLRKKPSQFKKFEKKIRRFYHNELHCCIQGTMELPTASNAPEFLLHHNFMDKLWYDWQSKGPEYKMKLDHNLDKKLLGSHYKVRHFMDPNNLGHSGTKVHFKDPYPGYKRLHRTLKALDERSLKMLDSYDESVKKSCCPKNHKDILRKNKELTKHEKNIPLEVSLDYANWE